MSTISNDEGAFSDTASMSDSVDSDHETTDPTTLDSLEDSPPPPKRRKFTSDEDAIIHSAFTIEAPSSSPAGEGLTLVPIVSLRRCQLPLAWLNPVASPTNSLPSLLFSANIPTLEEDASDPIVLVARSVDGGNLYAIERVKEYAYSLCGLGDWVKDIDLAASKRRLESSTTGRDLTSGTFDEHGQADWRRAAEISISDIDAGISAMHFDTDVSTAFGLDHNRTKSTLGDSRNNQESVNTLNVATGGADAGLSTLPDEQAESTPPTLSEILERLRGQYLEALYVSNTSVGYFAKGPLSRSRTSFQQLSGNGGPEQLADVANIYRDGILPMKKLDLKYRETLPNIINSLPAPLPDDEPAIHAKPSRKRKSKKKNKLGRNALYPEEEPLVEIWWRNRHPADASLPMGSSKQAEMRHYIADLRLREMQLQILWILETIAIEASIQGNPTPSAAGESSSSTKKGKAKKPEDLNVLLELLLDRLCIWHTVSFEEFLSADGTSLRGKNGSSGGKVEVDKLRDFCTEVIIPFYASRLPEQCKIINHKLGGPSAVSPVRQKRPQSKRAPQVQPGAPVQRTRPLNPRRALQRVLTDEKTTLRGRTPSLTRSNTAPTVPELKREPSEPASLHASFRGGIQNSKRFDNREVDLNTTAKHHEAKLRRMNKLMEQKKELDSAIDRLRKPNRKLVAKDFVDSVEQRSTTSKSRKSKNPMRNPLGQGVQVMVTPRGNRKKNVIQSSFSGGQFLSPVPNTDVQVVPASDIRPGYRSTTVSGADYKSGFPLVTESQPAEVSRVDATPSRRFSKSSTSLATIAHEEDVIFTPSRTKTNIFKVPILPHRSVSDIQTTPVKVSRADTQVVPDSMPRPKHKDSFETPQRQVGGYDSAVNVSPSVVRGRSQPPKPTSDKSDEPLYRSLGWEDDEDDELCMI
ncbi:hypothetical protein FQN54_007134 [Arachnomyces sp. PD_36]|nr:hypothetical protein FQN54_007134 [Arachnomyces sp. PD_36]